jgi:hypothetical protein
MPTMLAERDVAILSEPLQIDLSLNDLRIMVNCMKAVEYQMSMDDETYLDDDTRALKKRLEGMYEQSIVDLTNHKDPRGF